MPPPSTHTKTAKIASTINTTLNNNYQLPPPPIAPALPFASPFAPPPPPSGAASGAKWLSLSLNDGWVLSLSFSREAKCVRIWSKTYVDVIIFGTRRGGGGDERKIRKGRGERQMRWRCVWKMALSPTPELWIRFPKAWHTWWHRRMAAPQSRLNHTPASQAQRRSARKRRREKESEDAPDPPPVCWTCTPLF